MAEIAKVHTDRLKDLKRKVEEAEQYWHENTERYERFMRFVFKSSLQDDEATALASTGKPTIEFNILESYISRLRGEFAKQEPALTVRAADGVPLSMLNSQFTETLDLVEAHLRAIFFDGSNDMLDYQIYSDLLAGGFSVMRVFTEYVNEKSFEQNISVERVFDPTLTIFDPLARKSHKGDGRYCAELYPMTKSAFEAEYGKEATSQMKFTRSLSGFDWSFQNSKEEIVLICEYYEKKQKRETILQLSNGHSVTKKEYTQFLKQWEESGMIAQPPIPIKERRTIMEQVVRYRFCETEILDYTETNFKHLPLVFVDGNSVVMKEGGAYTQMTRPYVYHAMGIQRLKNFAGQCLGNELENSIQHRFMVAVEAIPSDESAQEAYRNVQKADVLTWNHFLDTNNPEVTLPPPQVIQRPQIPPEITNTFRGADEMTQMILGNYDAQQGVANAPVSGVAFARSAIQSNNASVPYIVGYIKGLNRVAQIIVDLIPKYYRTPRSLPILKPDGKREFKTINKQGSLYMNFDPNHLQVKVEAGVNFAMQKEIALQTLIAMSKANEGFQKFFNDEGLPVILDNIEIRGIDQLKEKANAWMERQKQKEAQEAQMQQQQMQVQAQAQQMQTQAQQMQMQAMQKELQSPTEAQVEAMYVQQKSQTDAANIAIKARDSETKFLEVMAKVQGADVDRELKAAEIMAEKERHSIDTVLKVSEQINKASQN
jgi:hypothetical protein